MLFLILCGLMLEIHHYFASVCFFLLLKFPFLLPVVFDQLEGVFMGLKIIGNRLSFMELAVASFFVLY